MTQHINILFQSSEGQKLLAESDASQTLLIRLFKKQQNNSFCGIQSSALLLSAHHYGAKFTDPACQKDCDLNSPPYVEENMFTFKETKSALDEGRVDAKGCTMPQVYKLLEQHGRKVQIYHADTLTAEKFRALAVDALSHKDSSCGVIVNYDENQLQEKHLSVPLHGICGHFSPLGAYHATSDRFLLLDVWYNAPEVWVKTDDLFITIQTVDPDSKKFRGFIILEG